MTIIEGMTALASGATGLYMIQKVIANLRKQPREKPVQNGERHMLLDQMGRIEQYTIEQGQGIARIDGRLNSFDGRLRAVEQHVAELRGAEPTPRSM